MVKIVCLMSLLSMFQTMHCSSAFTYCFNGGRLGDNLTTYIKAKWLSYKYDLPLLYQPFPYSDLLKLHDLEMHYTYEKKRKFKKEVMRLSIETERSLPIDRNAQALYWVHLYFQLTDWQEIDEIRDERFIALIKKLISPRFRKLEIALPQDKISVAAHVRRGGTFETPDFYKTTGMIYPPLRFPPDQFYIEQLKKVGELFPNKLIHVHIFTDDPEPQKIVDNYARTLNDPVFEFSCRKNSNSHDANVLEDLFSMAKFDCLIRPASGFSRIAQLIGDHKLVIAPKAFRFEGDQLIITDVKITHKKETL